MKNLTPITRKEMFMAKAAGQDVAPPEPITREEMFLADIAEHEEGQGGGGGSGGAFIVEYTIEESGGEYTVTNASHTFAEIKQAIADEKIIIARQIFAEGIFSDYPMADYNESSNTVRFGATAIAPVEGTTDVVASTISLTHGYNENADVYEFSVGIFTLATSNG